jgi:NADH:ubiquinone oxidoreductase subunit 4 (subunit M)
MAPLVILSLWIGVYPKGFLNYIQKPVIAVVKHVRPTYPVPATPGTGATDQAAIR